MGNFKHSMIYAICRCAIEESGEDDCLNKLRRTLGAMSRSTTIDNIADLQVVIYQMRVLFDSDMIDVKVHEKICELRNTYM